MAKMLDLKLLVVSFILCIIVFNANMLTYNIKFMANIPLPDRNLLSYVCFLRTYLQWLPGRILFLSNLFAIAAVVFELIYIARNPADTPLYKKQSAIVMNSNKKRKSRK